MCHWKQLRFASQRQVEYAAKLQAMMRKGFGGHEATKKWRRKNERTCVSFDDFGDRVFGSVGAVRIRAIVPASRTTGRSLLRCQQGHGGRCTHRQIDVEESVHADFHLRAGRRPCRSAKHRVTAKHMCEAQGHEAQHEAQGHVFRFTFFVGAQNERSSAEP